MTNSEINEMTAIETFNKIEVTRKSINKLEEWLKWNNESCIANEMKNSLIKRKVELSELQNRLDTLYENAI